MDMLQLAKAPIKRHNHLTTAGMFITLEVTSWTTILIGYRIYSTLKHNIIRSQHRFYRILKIILQSTFIYSLILLVIALLLVANHSGFYHTSGYMGAAMHAIPVRVIVSYYYCP